MQRRKKIHRVVRSSLAAETVALSNACEVTMWSKTLLCEMLMGRFIKEFTEYGDSYVLQTPFGLPPDIADTLKEVGEIARTHPVRGSLEERDCTSRL